MYTFWVKNVPEGYPNENDQKVVSYPSILSIHDEVYVYSFPQKEHDTNILNLIHVASNESLIFNSRKCQI